MAKHTQVEVGDLIEYYVDYTDEYFGLKPSTIYKVSRVDISGRFMLEGTKESWWHLAHPFRRAFDFNTIVNNPDRTQLFKYLKLEINKNV